MSSYKLIIILKNTIVR